MIELGERTSDQLGRGYVSSRFCVDACIADNELRPFDANQDAEGLDYTRGMDRFFFTLRWDETTLTRH